LYSQCNDYPDSIRGIQEHWLWLPYKKKMGCNALRNLHSDFDGYGVSGMQSQINSGIRIGRPFGGVGFLYNNKFMKAVKPLVSYVHERVCVLQLNTRDGTILLINGR
jgi:hypothetical protein